MAVAHLLSPTEILARVLELLAAVQGETSLAAMATRRGPSLAAQIPDDLCPESSGQRVLDRLGVGFEGQRSSLNAAVALPARAVLEAHGDALCREREPECQLCPLVSFCPAGRRRVVEQRTGLTVIDLFSGVGGLGRGFTQAGFKVIGAFESDRDAAQTYRLNHPGVPVLECDIARLSAADIRTWLGGETQVDVVVAGPPCQGYSAAGNRTPDDDRNYLFRHVSRLARSLRARVVVIENVPGARRLGDVAFSDRIVASLRRAGYSTASEPAVLQASDFGVPQRRRRLFFLAARDFAPTPPAPTHLRVGRKSRVVQDTTPTVLDVLEGLSALGPGEGAQRTVMSDGSVVLNHQAMNHSAAVTKKIAQIKPGEGPISYRRLHEDEARTLVAGHRALPVHPLEHRTITVREAARLQGFDDGFFFCGPRHSQPLQVANAVPPAMAQAVASALLEQIAALDESPSLRGSAATSRTLVRGTAL